jgi:hypothetical protein
MHTFTEQEQPILAAPYDLTHFIPFEIPLCNFASTFF